MERGSPTAATSARTSAALSPRVSTAGCGASPRLPGASSAHGCAPSSVCQWSGGARIVRQPCDCVISDTREIDCGRRLDCRAAGPRGACGEARPLPVTRAGRIGGPLSGAIGGSSKTARRGPRSAAALFRIRRSLGFVAEPMLYRRSDHPSRRRHREISRGGPFFRGAKRAARAGLHAPPAPRRAHCRRAALLHNYG